MRAKLTKPGSASIRPSHALIPVHVVHPEGRRAPAKVRAFVDLAVERLRANSLFQSASRSSGCGEDG